MAIKGKQKGKARSGRTVATGPRPVYVPPKTPLFQRTGTKVLLVALLEAAVFAILVGFDAQSDTEKAQEALTEYTQLVEAALFQEGAVQPLPVGASVLPELEQTIGTLGTEEAGKPDEIVPKTETWSTQATGAAERVAEVKVPSEGLEPEVVAALAEGKDEMRRGLLAYATLADQVGIALQLEGELQERAITAVQELYVVAGTQFTEGYQELQAQRIAVGLAPQTAPPPAGGLPGGLPGGIPGLPGQ